MSRHFSDRWAVGPRRPHRSGRRSIGGQVMALFALMATVLFVTIGLSVDAGFSYLASDAVERAAAGAALSGVPYLPDDPTNADKSAKVEAARNGFSDGDTGGGRNVKVATSQPAGTTHQLTVTISVDVPTTFLHILGFGTHTVTRGATAEYLRPIQLGQPGTQMGSPLCSGAITTNCLGSGTNAYYFVRTEGWGNPRHEGDAFTPSATADSAGYQPNPEDIHLLSNKNGTEDSNPAGVPNGVLSDYGGYNYLVYVPPGKNVDVQVYNPLFAPDNDPCSGQPNPCYAYHEFDSSFSIGSTNKADYSAMAYTIFNVTSLFQHTSESVFSQHVFYPIDATPAPGGYKWFDPSAGGTEKPVAGALPSTYHNWIDLLNYNPAGQEASLRRVDHAPGATSLSGGTSGHYYRFRVSNLDWQGKAPSGVGGSRAHKGYSLRLTDTAGTSCDVSANCGAATLSGLDDLCIYTPINNQTGSQLNFDIPVFQLDKEYAGKVISVNIYDPGDVSGNAYLKVMQPAYTGSGGVSHTATPATTVASGGLYPITNLGNQLRGGGTGTQITSLSPPQAYIQTANGSVIYNGKWVTFNVQVPNDWNPAANQFWSLEYTVDNGAVASDTITMQIGFSGTPVHLLP